MPAAVMVQGLVGCAGSRTSVPTAGFVLRAQPVGLGLTGLVALVLGMGVSCANTERHHVPRPGMV